ncbi:DUF3313 family protein [Halioxenophilus aromaticivorans]|uniref:DUF3313 domain-containing protein n=1 Tax=Halioxenophilus aromaticivorans TaxID=1306992 RepID=A0AAV3U3Y8_9ALTE
MKTKRYSNLIPIIGLSILTAACAPTGQKVKNHYYSADLSGLELDKSYSPTLVYVRPEAPLFDQYNKFIVDNVSINYNDPEMKELSPEDVAKIQNYFRDNLIASLREGGYEVTTKSQPDTMRISFYLSNLKAPSAAANVTAALAPFAISVGEVTVEAHFSEALNNRLDIVAIAHSQGSRLLNAKPWSTWSDIENALDQWVAGIRKVIDDAHK